MTHFIAAIFCCVCVVLFASLGHAQDSTNAAAPPAASASTVTAADTLKQLFSSYELGVF
jgi:hypothetical protein